MALMLPFFSQNDRVQFGGGGRLRQTCRALQKFWAIGTFDVTD